MSRLLLALLLLVGFATPATARPGLARAGDFDQGWRFALADPAGAQDPAFDDSAWRTLALPHDWSIELDPVKAGTTSGEAYYPGGTGWYRKTFTLPPEAAGKRVSLEFDGVYMDSSVYLNGTLVARHPYGYTGFEVDLTRAHTDGTPNVVAVKAVNPVPSSRWYSGSGIYRDVHLLITDPVHVERHGVTVTTPDLATTYPKGYAKVHAATAVAGKGKVTNEIEDAKGQVVAHGGADLRVDQPMLWSTAKPYRYTLVTKVSAGGRVVDTVRTPFGIRWFRFDPDEGFSLNGKYAKLQGVNLHSTLGALGGAVHRDAVYQQLAKMKAMGVNAVRTSHNPPSPVFVDVADELGILLMVEAFDCWQTGKRANDYSRFFTEHSDADITEMVAASRNSPAVILWSIGNEIPDGTKDIGVPMARRLIGDIRAADPTRPVVIGSHSYTSVPKDGTPQDQILRMLDGVGLNYDTAKAIDGLHAKYPGTFFFESESSSSTSARGEYQDPRQLNTGENYTPGKRGSSSYDNNMVTWASSGEHALKKDRDRKFFAGQFIWSGQDYLGEPTPYNSVFPVRSSFFGSVDTAGFEKDQFYLYQSQWSSKPMVHLVPMDWTNHAPGEDVTVRAYSNADKVELFLNGKSLGVRSFDHKKTTDGRAYLETSEQTGDDKGFPGGSYTSPNGGTGHLRLSWTVPFAPGELTAVASNGTRDTVRTAGAPASVRLRTEGGQSLSYVYADIVDAHGVVVPGADNEVTFAVDRGRVVGTDNGREEDLENFTSPVRHAYHGKILAIVTAGSQVTATLGAARAPAAVDASYSGSNSTLPAAMVDGKAATAWSNFYAKGATPQLPATSSSHANDWVALNTPGPRTYSGLNPTFTTGGTFSLPRSVRVSYWNGTAYVPVTGQNVVFAPGSDQESTITFDPVATTSVRLTMTSPAPGTANGFFKIAELRAP